MAIGKLGKPHRIVFSAKNFVSGLTDINIKVLKPNGSLHVNSTMAEFTESGFEGVYYYNILTTTNDPEGEYAVVINSVSQSYASNTKVTLVDGFGGGSVGTAENTNPELFGKIIESKITGKILQDSSLTGKIQSNLLSGQLIDNTIKAIIQSEKIIAKISEEKLIYRLSGCE